MVLLNPKRVFLSDGYHGVHAILDVMNKLTGVQKLSLDQLDHHHHHLLHPGDIIHIETPLNPTGEARNLAYYSAKAHAAGAYLTVDSTLAPPPLQDPLQFGADVVLHSGTKYIGGHSDMMCGILVVHPERVMQGWLERLYSERMVLGSVMGSLEGWLGLRSLRTLELRVKRQSRTAEQLVGVVGGGKCRGRGRSQWWDESWIGCDMCRCRGETMSCGYGSRCPGGLWACVCDVGEECGSGEAVT